MLEVIFRRVVTSSSQDGLAMGVVPGSFLGIGEDFVGRLDFGEFGGCAFDVAKVSVGVEFKSLSSVCFLDSMKISVPVFQGARK